MIKKPSLEKSLLPSISSSNLEKVTDFLSLFRPTFHLPAFLPAHNRTEKLFSTRNLAKLPLSHNFVQRMRKRILYTQKVSFHNSTLQPSYAPRTNASSDSEGGEEDGRQRSSTRNRTYSKRIGVSPSTVRPPFSLIPSSISQHTRARTVVHPRPSTVDNGCWISYTR